MTLLYWFESIRTPVLDTLMSLVTHLGEETFFMAAALLVFWCRDKRRGYYLLSIGFAGTLLNQWLKIVFRVPRPWVKDPNFTIVESARAEAGGYSFPSGHTQSAAGWMGGFARSTHRLWLRIGCVGMLLLVSVSRMYLGVHTPQDVAVSLVIAALLVFIMYPLVESTLWFPNRMYIIIGVLVGLSLAFVGFVELFPFPADTDPANLASAVSNACKMAGASAGVLVVYAFDSRVLQFSNRAPLWGQLIKLVGGLVFVVAVKTGLKILLAQFIDTYVMLEAVQYFVVVLAAGCVWPMTFRFFERYAR